MSLTWLDLEAKFKELEEELPYTRVDAHWGGREGEVWQLAGPFEPGKAQRFETVARIGGNKLLAQLRGDPDLPSEVEQESDPVIRWYKAIWKFAGGFRFDYRDQPQSDGKPTTKGAIKNIVKASRSLCRVIQTDYGDPQAAAPPPPAKSGIFDSVKSIFGKKK